MLGSKAHCLKQAAKSVVLVVLSRLKKDVVASSRLSGRETMPRPARIHTYQTLDAWPSGKTCLEISVPHQLWFQTQRRVSFLLCP